MEEDGNDTTVAATREVVGRCSRQRGPRGAGLLAQYLRSMAQCPGSTVRFPWWTKAGGSTLRRLAEGLRQWKGTLRQWPAVRTPWRR